MIKFTGPEDRIIRVSGQLSEKLSEKLSDKLSDKLSVKEQKTLELLLEDPGYTSPQIAEKLNVSRISVTKYLKYMRAKITYEGIQRIERYFVPEAALREALLNAVCHKQYQSGVPVQISVYKDRLYVANVGSLPEDWTLEKLMNKHTSKPYNPTIAYVFYLAGFIESWECGVEKICNALKADNLPIPEYTVNSGDIMIKFTGLENRIIRVSDRVNDKVNEGVNVHVNDRQKELLSNLIQDPGYTVSQLSEIMKVRRKTIAGYLKTLKDKGIIERISSARNGYWKIVD